MFFLQYKHFILTALYHTESRVQSIFTKISLVKSHNSTSKPQCDNQVTKSKVLATVSEIMLIFARTLRQKSQTMHCIHSFQIIQTHSTFKIFIIFFVASRRKPILILISLHMRGPQVRSVTCPKCKAMCLSSIRLQYLTFNTTRPARLKN